MFSSFINAIRSAIRYIRNLIRKVINGILDFARHVVSWFRNKNLNPQKDTVFIANQHKLKELLNEAPRKQVGIFKGVYDEERDEIVHHELVEADALDAQTRGVLGNESLVVLQ